MVGLEHEIRVVSSVINRTAPRKNERTDVSWLNLDNVLSRFIALENDIVAFLSEEGKQTPDVDDEQQLKYLALITDNLDPLNTPNRSVQGKDYLILDIRATPYLS